MNEEFDYIVVGAGSSGCVVAARLSEDPNCRVLLLEAGGPDSHLYLKMPLAFLKAMVDPKFNWNYNTEPEPALNGRSLWLPRGRVVGGSSSINGMFYMRGHPLDFDDWEKAGAKGWNYASVLPYFRKMEKSWRGESLYHGKDGPVDVRPVNKKYVLHEALMDAAAPSGFTISEDLAAERPEGFALGELTIDPSGRRASAATAYLTPALKRPNLKLVTHALASKIDIEDGRATGVTYTLGGESRSARARQEVILSGGAYNSPHLLMLSGIGPAKHLAEHGVKPLIDNLAVGGNLSEHAHVSVEFDATRPVTFLNYLRYDRLALASVQWALFGKGPLASQINSCNVIVRTDPSLDRPDIQFMANPIRFEAAPWFPLISKKQSHLFWAGIVSLHPKSRGSVTLKSANPMEKPAVRLNLLADPRDFEPLRRGVRAARRVYRMGEQGKLTGQERTPGEHVQSDADLDAYIRETAVVAQHPVGTCAMGSGPGAVVDADLRVIGVDGLRVVDASVMPAVPGGNTNAACMMIGERASDLIRGRTLPPASLQKRAVA